MKAFFFAIALVPATLTVQAQAPAGSKLAAEQAFVKEINRVFAYIKEQPGTTGHSLIKAPALGHTGVLTLTFGYTENGSACREIVTVPIDRSGEITTASGLGLKGGGEPAQRIKLCSGKQPSSAMESVLQMGSIADTAVAKGFATDLETALRRLQTFYK